jgi:hypothetical protein
MELYSVPIEGGTPLKITGVRAPGADEIGGVLQTRDGSRVIYLAEQDSADSFELYVTSITSLALPIADRYAVLVLAVLMALIGVSTLMFRRSRGLN